MAATKIAQVPSQDEIDALIREARQMRARAFALRDVFPDVLRGMPVAEELQDMANAAPPPG